MYILHTSFVPGVSLYPRYDLHPWSNVQWTRLWGHQRNNGGKCKKVSLSLSTVYLSFSSPSAVVTHCQFYALTLTGTEYKVQFQHSGVHCSLCNAWAAEKSSKRYLLSTMSNFLFSITSYPIKGNSTAHNVWTTCTETFVHILHTVCAVSTLQFVQLS